MASEDITNRDPDPFADSLRSDAPDADLPGPTFVGFYTRQDDRGRLYFAKGAYIEFALEHVAFHSTVPENESPVDGKQATRIQFTADAELVYKQEERTVHFTIDPRAHPLTGYGRRYISFSSHYNCC